MQVSSYALIVFVRNSHLLLQAGSHFCCTSFLPGASILSLLCHIRPLHSILCRHSLQSIHQTTQLHRKEHLKHQCIHIHKMISSINAAVFKLDTRSRCGYWVKEEEASWWQQHSNSFQTRPQSATGQDRHYNTEKSTRLPWTHTHTDHFSTHTQHLCFKRPKRREQLSLLTPFRLFA